VRKVKVKKMNQIDESVNIAPNRPKSAGSQNNDHTKNPFRRKRGKSAGRNREPAKTGLEYQQDIYNSESYSNLHQKEILSAVDHLNTVGSNIA